MLSGLVSDEYNAILTWASDRLSRNAGDLGAVVDLMDQGKLLHIRTYSQTFTNNPNEKFLLMILCSQAKLENDNKSINVKRGMKTKLDMGWRPGVAPLGYINRAFGGVKDIILDPERAPIIKQVFEKTAQGVPGREIKAWLREIECTNRSGKYVSLSQVYMILNNPFYYGEFEWPDRSGKWYKGAHEPLITKELFDQIHTGRADYKGGWGIKTFAFKGLLVCGTCGCNVVGEDKHKILKDGTNKRYVFYRCTKKRDYSCPEKYMNEYDVQEQIKQYIMDNADKIEVSNDMRRIMAQHQRVMLFHLTKHGVKTDKLQPLATYADYVLSSSNAKLITELVQGIHTKFALKGGKIGLV